MRGGRAAPAPAQTSGALGFDSLFGLLAWGGALILLLIAPTQIANYWPGDYNFWPQSLFSLLLAGVALMLAISRLPIVKFDGVAWSLALFLGWCLLSVFTGTYAHDAWLELGRNHFGAGVFLDHARVSRSGAKTRLDRGGGLGA